MGIFGAVQIVKERQVSEKEAFLRNISVRGGGLVSQSKLMSQNGATRENTTESA